VHAGSREYLEINEMKKMKKGQEQKWDNGL